MIFGPYMWCEPRQAKSSAKSSADGDSSSSRCPKSTPWPQVRPSQAPELAAPNGNSSIRGWSRDLSQQP